MLNAKFVAAASVAVVALSFCHFSHADAGGAIMLMDPDVQTELNLDGTQKGSIELLKNDLKPNRDLSDVQAHMVNILKPEQLKRLGELRIQSMGTISLSCPDVADTLHLSYEQQTAVTKILRSFYDTQAEMSPEELALRSVDMYSKVKDTLWAVLNATQCDQLVAMAGEPSKLFEEVAR